MACEDRELSEDVLPVLGFQGPGGEGLASVLVVDDRAGEEFGGDAVEGLLEVAGRAAGAEMAVQQLCVAVPLALGVCTDATRRTRCQRLRLAFPTQRV
jgi:hypothetical protein